MLTNRFQPRANLEFKIEPKVKTHVYLDKKSFKPIHEKKDFCGRDGYLGKKKIGGRFGLKMA